MSTEVLVAVLSFAGTVIGSIVGILAAQKLTVFRLDRLEKTLEKRDEAEEKHKERTTKLEGDVTLIKKDITDIKGDVKEIKSELSRRNSRRTGKTESATA